MVRRLVALLALVLAAGCSSDDLTLDENFFQSGRAADAYQRDEFELDDGPVAALPRGAGQAIEIRLVRSIGVSELAALGLEPDQGMSRTARITAPDGHRLLVFLAGSASVEGETVRLTVDDLDDGPWPGVRVQPVNAFAVVLRVVPDDVRPVLKVKAGIQEQVLDLEKGELVIPGA